MPAAAAISKPRITRSAISIGQPLRDHPQLLQWDGEHPNEQGQRVLSDAVARALDDAGVTL